MFRTLPWKYFSVWDGGFLFSGLAVAFLLIMANYVVFVKKWRWADMYKPVMMSLHLIFSTILSVYGALLQNERIVLLSMCAVLLFVLYMVQDKVWANRGKSNFYGIVIFALLATALEAYIFLTSEITNIDKGNILVFVGYTVFVTVMYAIDLRRAYVDKTPALPVKQVSIERNKAIRIKKEL